MSDEIKLPFKRDWLNEALEIAANKRPFKGIKLAHIRALAEEFANMKNTHMQMRDLLQKALKAAQNERTKQGLPEMPNRPDGAA